MAHELAFVNGKASIAYVGEKPWHGMGQVLTKDAPIEKWVVDSGLDYQIEQSPCLFNIPTDSKKKSTAQTIDLGQFANRKVLYRSDTKSALSVVSDSYNIVQPKEVLEFFRDLVAAGGNMHLETAGALFGGTRYWAMANTNREGDVIKNDRVKARLLLTSSCDGTLATTAKFVAERVVCNNTLKIALGEETDKKQQVRVTHGAVFNPMKIKESLGLIDAGWDIFMGNLKKMAHKKVTDLDVKKFIAEIMLNKEQLEVFEKEEALHRRVDAKLTQIFEMYKGTGMGSSMVTGTLWGALNAVTEYADHHIGQIDDNKLWGSWFGYSENLKNKAFEIAMDLV